MEKSYFLEDIIVKKYPKIEEDMSCDVVIIGGGISGILCSYFLSEAGYNVTLIEGKRLYSGSTCHTTAHISKIEDYIYQDLIKFYNKDVSKEYYKSRVLGIKKYDELIKKNSILCDYEIVNSNFFCEENCKKLEKEYELMKEYGDEVLYSENTYVFDKKVKGLLTSKDNRTFHPIKFLEGLDKNFTIYEQTMIEQIDFEMKELITDSKKKVRFNYAVVCTNFPLLKVKGLYPLKMYKSNSYNNYYKSDNGNFKIDLYEDVKEDGITYRTHNGILIQGGLDNRCGIKTPNINDFNKDLKEVFKDINFYKNGFETACDSMTFDGMPYIGTYLKNNTDVYLVTGFNKYGMINSMISALEITSLIKNKKSLFNNIFSPHRKVINKDYMTRNLLQVLKGFTISNVRIKHRCTHLYGKLFYNDVSKSYECPLHGSRFDLQGNVIEGPAKENLK